ncbi:hypothetical protein SBADM41S_09612 [Streptomyces badius]
MICTGRPLGDGRYGDTGRGGSPVYQAEARRTSVTGVITDSGTSPLPVRSRSRARSSRRAISRPCPSISWPTVVSGGSVSEATESMSSKPTSATCPGTETPRSRRTRSAPEAIRSLAANTTSRSGRRSSSSAIARAPLSTVNAPSATSVGSTSSSTSR